MARSFRGVACWVPEHTQLHPCCWSDWRGRNGFALIHPCAPRFHEAAILQQQSRDALFNYLKVTIAHTNVPAELTLVAFGSALPDGLEDTIASLREKHLPAVRAELEGAKN